VNTETVYPGRCEAGLVMTSIGPIPGRLHPAVTKEQPFNFVRFGIFQGLPTRDLIPFRKPRVKHPVRHDASNALEKVKVEFTERQMLSAVLHWMLSGRS
jgi:hypothetical protein